MQLQAWQLTRAIFCNDGLGALGQLLPALGMVRKGQDLPLCSYWQRLCPVLSTFMGAGKCQGLLLASTFMDMHELLCFTRAR